VTQEQNEVVNQIISEVLACGGQTMHQTLFGPGVQHAVVVDCRWQFPYPDGTHKQVVVLPSGRTL
jgi:acyl CoA:acetate/3-ketoacid CoA transferase